MNVMSNTQAPASACFACFEPNPKAIVRLFCFPYAGGGAIIYRDWVSFLPSAVELWAAQPSGRGNRLKEAPATHIESLLDDLSNAQHLFFDKPFVFFGHSLGALVAFEMAHRLAIENGLEPAHMIVSGRRAPQIPKTDAVTYNLPEDEFIEELRRLNGTRSEILEHPELMKMVIPILRADFAVCDTYEYTAKPQLSCSMTALGGLQDKEVTPEDLQAWKDHTTGPFLLNILPGDHFFLHSAQATVLRIISRDIHKLMGAQNQR